MGKILKKSIDARRARHLKDGEIAVDLDGTLAFYDYWRGMTHIGEPIPEMLNRVKEWVAEGYTVKIFTARLSEDPFNPDHEFHSAIREYTLKHVGVALEATCIKRMEFVEFWDDRGIQIIGNTGRTVIDEMIAIEESLEGKP